jgi:RNA polymerase sigma-70 factor, ECF subfamily
MCNESAPRYTSNCRSAEGHANLPSTVDTSGIADGELARRIGAGTEDRAAEAELCRRFGNRIRLYGLRHLRDRTLADDLVQQVLVLAVQSLRQGRVREPDRLASFILGSCRMMVRDLHRGESRRQHLAGKLDTPLAASDPVFAVDLERLRTCVEGLPTRERTVVMLTFYGDRDGDEIAAELSMTTGNVRVVRHRALVHLQECMGVVEEPA